MNWFLAGESQGNYLKVREKMLSFFSWNIHRAISGKTGEVVEGCLNKTFWSYAGCALGSIWTTDTSTYNKKINLDLDILKLVVNI